MSTPVDHVDHGRPWVDHGRRWSTNIDKGSCVAVATMVAAAGTFLRVTSLGTPWGVRGVGEFIAARQGGASLLFDLFQQEATLSRGTALEVGSHGSPLPCKRQRWSSGCHGIR